MTLVGREPRAPRTVALLAYATLSVLFFGLPILSHPGRSYLGAGSDPQIFIWCLAWWPHAIGHGTNPFTPHVVWAPGGLNLAWSTCVPALAAALAPVTLLAGPTPAYNLAGLAMPALAAWAAFLLCRYLTRRFWASLVGGYLFGFSSYMLGQLLGHLHLSSVFLLPLLALLVLRRLDGQLDGRGLAVRLGPVLAVQLYLSTEVAFTASLALLVALVATFAMMPERRGDLRRLAAALAGSYAVAAVLSAPLLYFAASGYRGDSIHDPSLYPADLANVVVPTRLTTFTIRPLQRLSDQFAANVLEAGAYLGVPLLAVVALFAWSRRRRRSTWLLLLLLALTLLAELGDHLTIAGRRSLWLPSSIVERLPLFDNALPARFSVYAALLTAVMAALWIAEARWPPWSKIVVIALVIDFLLPNVEARYWKTTPIRPEFFASGLYRTCLARGDNVLALPIGGKSTSLLWQAEHGFRFRLADSDLGTPTGLPKRVEALARTGQGSDADARTALDWLIDKRHATVVLASADKLEGLRPVVAALPRPRTLEGVALWRIRGTPPQGCG